jgi:plastocyanin
MNRLILPGIAGMIALIAAGCSSNSSNPGTPSAQATNVSIVLNSSNLTTTAYNPNPVTIARGGTVMWINNDTTPHTSTADGGLWNSGNLAAGASFSMTFPNTGSFPYHCTLHPGMVGTVNVQ